MIAFCLFLPSFFLIVWKLLLTIFPFSLSVLNFGCTEVTFEELPPEHVGSTLAVFFEALAPPRI